MNVMEFDNKLQQLHEQNQLNGKLLLWGIGPRTEEIANWLLEHGYQVACILDNFKYTFYQTYKVSGQTIPVRKPEQNMPELKNATVLLGVHFADAIQKQLQAYGVHNIIHLNGKQAVDEELDISYHFIDRSKGRSAMCYILAGYDKCISKIVLERISRYQSDQIDYCLASSGIYSVEMDKLAEQNGWSYLYMDKNQVCYLQNLIIEKHPKAELIFKFDEDILIGEGFFESMLEGYQLVEHEGECRVGFVVPIVPLNCSGYVSYLEGAELKAEFEERFGRAYRSRFSVVFGMIEAAEYLWQSMGTFDAMCKRFATKEGYRMYNCYYNIGCILYSRERWLMMGKWPVSKQSSGMGDDERFILQDNMDKDMAIYELNNVLAGHFAFGPQKQKMQEFFENHRDIFECEK